MDDYETHSPYGLNEDGSTMIYADTDAYEFETLQDAFNSIDEDHKHYLNEAVKVHAWDFADSVEDEAKLIGAEELIIRLQELMIPDVQPLLQKLLEENHDAQDKLEALDLQNTFADFSSQFDNLNL